MPIKSKAQRRNFAELLVKGEISPETFEEWNRGAGDAELPERLHPKPTKSKRRSPSKRAAKAKSSRVRPTRSKSATSKSGRRTAKKR